MRIGNSPQQDAMLEQLRQQNDVRSQTDIRNQDESTQQSALQATRSPAEAEQQTGVPGQVNDRLAADQTEGSSQKHSRNLIDIFA